ncbi:hypothetical protein ACU8KH_06093 [Lachancea thermotolerans]
MVRLQALEQASKKTPSDCKLLLCETSEFLEKMIVNGEAQELGSGFQDPGNGVKLGGIRCRKSAG